MTDLSAHQRHRFEAHNRTRPVGAPGHHGPSRPVTYRDWSHS